MNKSRQRIITSLKYSMQDINKELEKGRLFFPSFAVVPKVYTLTVHEEREAQKKTQEGYLAHIHDHTYVITKKGYELLK